MAHTILFTQIKLKQKLHCHWSKYNSIHELDLMNSDKIV